MSITDAHLIPSDLALAIWSLTMPVNGLLLQIAEKKETICY